MTNRNLSEHPYRQVAPSQLKPGQFFVVPNEQLDPDQTILIWTEEGPIRFRDGSPVAFDDSQPVLLVSPTDFRRSTTGQRLHAVELRDGPYRTRRLKSAAEAAAIGRRITPGNDTRLADAVTLAGQRIREARETDAITGVLTGGYRDAVAERLAEATRQDYYGRPAERPTAQIVATPEDYYRHQPETAADIRHRTEEAIELWRTTVGGTLANMGVGVRAQLAVSTNREPDVGDDAAAMAIRPGAEPTDAQETARGA